MKSIVQNAEALESAMPLPVAKCLDISLAGRATYGTRGDSRGVRLICLDGLVWVTQAGDPADYLLRAGQSFAATCPGIVLIQGLPKGRVRMVPALRCLSTPRHPWRTRSPLDMPGLVES